MAKSYVSAHQLLAVELDAGEATEKGDGDAIRDEEALGHRLDLVGGYGFDAGD